MLEEASIRDFEQSPVGKLTTTGSCVVWCATPSLTGWHVWGKPDEAETRTLLQLLSLYPKIGETFDVVTDTRAVEVVNPTALSLLVPWLLLHRRELKRRVRLQVNVIRRGPIGFLLNGIIASIGDVHPYRTYTEPLEAFRSVAGDRGAALSEQIEAVAARVGSIPRELQALRTLLASRMETTIEDASKALSTSPRSLQRALTRHGTSFHEEQTHARFAAAKSLLTASDLKIASVAASVGWSESTLKSIFRARTGLTPTDWRKRETG